MGASKFEHKVLHFVSYGLAGVVSISTYIAGMSLLYVTLGWNIYLAGGASFSVAVVASYILNRRLTFVYFGTHRALVRYIVVLLLAQALNLLVLSVLIENFGYGYYSSQVVAVFLITPLNYILNLLWVFNKKQVIR